MGQVEQGESTEKKDFWQLPAVIAVFAIFCTALWGSATPAIKIGYEILQIDATDIATKMVFAGVRFSLAGVIILAFMAIKTKDIKLWKRGDSKAFISIGLLNALQYICFYIGLTYTTGAKGSLFSSVNGFIIVLISPLIYKSEKLNANKVIGCIVAVIGLVLITLDGGVQELSGFKFEGEGLVVFASAFHAVSFYMTKAFAKTRRAEVIAGWQLFIGGVALAVLGFIFGGSVQITSFSGVAVILYLATVSSLAYMLWSILISRNKISSVSMYNLFTPIFGTILSGIVLAEVIFTWQNISSLVLVSLGVWLVNTSSKVFCTKKQMQFKLYGTEVK